MYLRTYVTQDIIRLSCLLCVPVCFIPNLCIYIYSSQIMWKRGVSNVSLQLAVFASFLFDKKSNYFNKIVFLNDRVVWACITLILDNEFVK